MLPTRRFQRSAAILAGLITFVGITLVNGVALTLPAAADPAHPVPPQPAPTQPAAPQPSGMSRGFDRPDLALFAVGDTVWRDDNRSGVQDSGESPAAQISVQLLNADGDVVSSTVSGPSGRYIFDNLPAGTYSVRFAGVPREFRLTPTAVGDQRAIDSDPDYSGVTPPFTLGVGEPNVRPTTAADQVAADYINPTVDAGFTPLRYAIANRVWLDLNSDGIQQLDEPAGSATVSLLTEAGNVVATTTTDASGRYEFSNLRGGGYRLQFKELPPHRAFTEQAAGADPALDSDPDPVTGSTPLFKLTQGAPNLAPVSDANAGSTDFENQTLSAGLVGAYSVGDTVWRDNNGDGVLGAGESGVPGVTVELLDADSNLIATTVTSETGRYTFDKLPAGNYKIKFSKVPDGLVFTCRDSGDNASVDSDVDPSGMTAMLALGTENPADTSVDAGLTTRSKYRGTPDENKATVDAALSTTGGVAPQLPVLGAVLAVAGVSCLLIARRRSR